MKSPPYDHSVHFPLHGAPVLGAHAQALHPILALRHLESKKPFKSQTNLSLSDKFCSSTSSISLLGSTQSTGLVSLAIDARAAPRAPVPPIYQVQVRLGNLTRFTCQVNQKVVRLKVEVFFAEFCHRFLVIAVGGVRVDNALYF